jgi:uroporphyrinogen-III synthase
MSTGPIVALLESRMSSELARLISKHGGTPLSVPAVRESPELTSSAANQLINDLEASRYEIVIFMTGVAVSLLFEAAERVTRRPDLVRALRQVTTVCRGPKPTAALRGFGLPPTLSAQEPFTAAEVLDAMSGIEVCGKKVLLFHYGERSDTLAETLIAWRAQLDEFWLYRWLMPADLSGLQALVKRIVDREIQGLGITCQVQFRHLMKVAEDMRLERPLVRALNERVVVGAVGPKCSAVLQSRGVRVHIIPEHPKMGPLAVAMMRHLNGQSHADRSPPLDASA